MKTKMISLMLMIAAFVCVTSCSTDDDTQKPTLNKTSITLNVDETFTLVYSGEGCAWTSDDPLIASVKDGIVKGEHVGTTIIHANDLTCEVTVKPQYTGVFEPCMQWGKNLSEIQKYMSGYTLRSSSNTSLTYEGKGDIIAYTYSFDNEKLSSSAFLVELSYVSFLTDYLLERYVVFDVDQNNYRVYMVTTDLKTMIAMEIATYGAMVVYLPVPEQSTRYNQNVFDHSVFENVKQKLNLKEIKGKEGLADIVLNNNIFASK